MHLRHLTLDQFRIYDHLDLELPVEGLRVSGRNASGKSSLLESIVMLSTTRSPRTSMDRDLVRWNSGEDYGVPPYARITGELQTENEVRRVGINIELDSERQAVNRKQFIVNGDAVRAHELIGAMKCVLFSPEDVYLVAGPPSERRRQIDILISQIDRTYLYALTQYAKVLAQRNQLLKRFARERRSHRDSQAVNEISFWDEEIIASGSTIIAYRFSIVRRLGDHIGTRSSRLVDGSDIHIRYQPRLQVPNDQVEGNIGPDRDRIAAIFQSTLESVRHDEFRRGMSLIGPHRDDYVFGIDGRELATYGSRGQQRLGVVAYRLAEIDIVDERSGERPILLLDDVLSELDQIHRELLLTAVADCGCQIVVTSADASTLDEPGLSALPAIRVEDGRLLPTVSPS